ncbi:hypothetical protein LAZ67_X001918 [Cordylochernes scorpioides]|uniref:Reverse transcriptase Ty1/copia-type domain-containing protein n=1 Tax=Cordylochernes scorpioides TaxID=51811 RepID=A0ABY6LX53_9ARAC|nr:hypothetical protein LAZ67_X001918 [Cordylochernes scorpioides]
MKTDSFRTLLAYSTMRDYEFHHFDVETAFLYGKLTETIYMTQPEGYQRQVTILSRFDQSPREIHIGAAKRIIRYLKGTKQYGLIYCKGDIQLTAYSDASWNCGRENHYFKIDYRINFLFRESTGSLITDKSTQSNITESRQDYHNEGDHNEEGKKTVQIDRRAKKQRWRNKHAIPTKRPSNLPSTTQPTFPQNKPVRSYPPSTLQRNHPDDMPPSPNRSHKLLQALHGTPSTSSGQQPKTKSPD